jgi:5'-nucleotidase (lipoprotein e(P4) family)
MMRTSTAIALALLLALPATAAAPRKKAAPAKARPAAAAAAAGDQTYYPPEPPLPSPQLHGIQYLYGSAEAYALTRQTWRMLADFVDEAMASGTHRSVVLAADATLAQPKFVPCDNKPVAIVLDVDETSILNLGAEYDDLLARRKIFDDDVWVRWEQTGGAYVVPTPGAKEALDRLREHGVTVIFNTNRAAFDAPYTEKMLNDAGLGPAKHLETLFLSGDDSGGSMKDGRRQTIAAKYCVVAMAGDQLVDFSDHFDFDQDILSVQQRRAAAALPGILDLWGNGWFVMPNPVYGSALQGGPDDIFPKDKQWRDPGPKPAPAPAPTEEKAK